MSTSYNSREFVRVGDRPGRTVGLSSLFTTDRNSHFPTGFVLMMEQHNMDWSDDSPQSDPGDNDAGALLTGTFDRLTTLVLGLNEVPTSSEIRDKVLDVFKQANAIGQQSGIPVSLLSVLWVGNTIRLASVGVCKCYLVRGGRAAQINADDYARLVIDGATHTSSIMLSNVVGLGTIVSFDDIHWVEFKIEPNDVLVIGSESFHQNVSEEVISTGKSAGGIDEVCSFLEGAALAKTHPSDPLALCVIQPPFELPKVGPRSGQTELKSMPKL